MRTGALALWGEAESTGPGEEMTSEAPNSSPSEPIGRYPEDRSRLFTVVRGGRIGNNRQNLKQWAGKRSSLDPRKKCLHRETDAQRGIFGVWNLSEIWAAFLSVRHWQSHCHWMSDLWNICCISDFAVFIVSVVIMKNSVRQFCSSFWTMFPTELNSKKKNYVITRYAKKTAWKMNCAASLPGPFAVMNISLEMEYIWWECFNYRGSKSITLCQR